MNTYRLGPDPSDIHQKVVSLRVSYTSAQETASLSVASHGTMHIRIEGGGVVLASEQRLSAAGVPYTGHAATDEELDDLETFRRIQAFEKNFEGLDEDGRAAKRQDMRASGELLSWEEVKARQRAKRGL